MKRLLCMSLFVYGCAAQSPYERSNPGDPKAEIAHLELRIDALLHDRIGVQREATPPPPPVVAPPPPAAAPPPLAEQPPPREENFTGAPRPMATEVAPAVPPPAPAKSWRVPRRSRRCRDMADASAEICDAAERICRLAEQIGDSDSARSCGRAREDCRRSGDIAAACR